MADPEKILVLLGSLHDSAQVSRAKVTVKCYCSVFALLEFLGNPLWVLESQILLIWVGQREIIWVLFELMVDRRWALGDNFGLLFHA